MEVVIDNLSEKAQYDFKLVSNAIDNNDQSAYTEIMERYREPIFFMLLKMVKNESDAEDLTIEAFGKAFKRIHQYTPNYAFSTWLFKIATNNCIDFIRKKKMQTLSIDTQTTDEDGMSRSFDIESDTLGPEGEFMKDQKVKLMRKVVTQLKPRYRRLIELRFFKEYSYEEISEELDIPLGTVKAQLFRAKELLYNILKDRKETI